MEWIFDEIHKQAIERETEGVKINMPQPTDHLFFQFCHARKHLLASGVGIRQICDILLFAEHYEKEIDWEIFWDRIRMTDGILFAEAIFRLGVQYLGFKEKQFYFPEGVNSMKLDTERLMEDILHSGIHGKGTRSRLHSGTLTLHAAEKEDCQAYSRSVLHGISACKESSVAFSVPEKASISSAVCLGAEALWLSQRRSGFRIGKRNR